MIEGWTHRGQKTGQTLLQESYSEILKDRLDLKEQMIAQMQQGLEEYAETITQQARDIEGYERQQDRPLLPTPFH